ncbi:MAG TPA: HD domain-containing protein [Candidatus Sulfomarinibacteraceae bacterium]|nr:HD domain-containing protein [Candidatus Sulfomarinibacteraceae bacterium]
MNEQDSLALHQLPAEAVAVIEALSVSPHLLAHLVLVHDVAARLVQGIQLRWPDLSFDADAVQFGAAVHDIGKVQHPEEMTGPGSKHHAAGVALLETHGMSSQRARFARTHATWERERDIRFEDLLVALADIVWAGGRNQKLEDAVTTHLAASEGSAVWEAYMGLDDILTQLSAQSDLRLIWQTQFASEPALLGEAEDDGPTA